MKRVLLLILVCAAALFAAPPRGRPVRRVRRAHSRQHNLSSRRPHSLAGLPGNGEFMIDPSTIATPTDADEFSPAAAFDGTNYLVVWANDEGLVSGTRVTPEGIALDPGGIQISSTDAEPASYVVDVSYDGTNYLVVWDGGVNGSICGARVTPAGMLLDSVGISISRGAAGDTSYHSPSVSRAGSYFLVVWEEWWGDEHCSIYGTRVSSAGKVLDDSGLAISTKSPYHYTPQVSSNGRDFLVVWEEWRSDTEDGIYGSRVTPDGQVLDTPGFAVSGTLAGESPCVAGSGDNGFMVAWLGFESYSAGIYCARVSADGVLVDTSGVFVASFWVDPDELWPPRLSLACNGHDFLAVWGTDEDYVGSARINREGVPHDTLGSPLVPETFSYTSDPAVASNGDGWFAVWEDDRAGVDIYGARVKADGAVRDPTGILLSSSVNNQWGPSVSFNGSLFFVVWESWDTDFEVSNIYGIRIGPDGAVLDPAGFRICTAPGNPYEPAVGSDGTNFLAVWVDGRSGRSALYGARVTSAGTLLDSSGIPISTGADGYANPAVAFDGMNYLVVWEVVHGDSDDIRGARVTRSGRVLDTVALPISLAPNMQNVPKVAFADTTYLVVWGDHRGPSQDIYAARVTRSGRALDPLGRPVSLGAHNQSGPAIAYDGRQFLVTWSDGRNGSTDIYGARVTAGGDVLDPYGIAISRSVHAKWNSAVGFDDSDFAVVWEDWVGATATIHGAKVSRSGVVLDTGRVTGELGDQETPALAHGPGTELFLIYSGWTDAANGRWFQAYRLWGRFDPFPGEVRPSTIPLFPGAEMSIINNVLRVPSPLTLEARTRYVLVNAAGRAVLELHAGDNDVSGLAPGVYFQVHRPAGSTANRRKVVIVR